MLAQTILSLLFIAVLLLVKTRQRYDNMLVLLAVLLAGTVFYAFMRDWIGGSEGFFTLLWNSSKSGDIKISIHSSLPNYTLIFPFFVITLISLLGILFFRYEQKKKGVSLILLLNLVSLAMLVAGNNFIQIITFVFAVDILSQLLISDINASRRYSIYNLTADMGLFLVLAMVHGNLENLEVANISAYFETGRHRDFVAAVILISLFIKMGFFLFQGYLLDLKSARFHRLILIPYLSTPMVALILFMKFYPLLVVSPIFIPVLDVVAALSLAWGAAGAVVINSLKEKTVYLNMMIFALLVKLVETNGAVWNIHFSYMLVLGYMFNCCIYFLHYYAGRENNVAYIAGQKRCENWTYGLVLAAAFAVVAAFAVQAAALYNLANSVWMLFFGLLFTFSAAYAFNQILRGRNTLCPPAEADLRPLPVLAVIIVFAGAVFYREMEFWREAAVVAVLFGGWLLVYPLSGFFANVSLNKKLQNLEIFSRLYDVLIAAPLHSAGRMLTILVDFVFFERTVVSAFSSFNTLIIRGFRKITRAGLIYYALCIVLAFAGVFWFLMKGSV